MKPATRQLIRKLYMIQANLEIKDEAERELEWIFPDMVTDCAKRNRSLVAQASYVLRAMGYCGPMNVATYEEVTPCESTSS